MNINKTKKVRVRFPNISNGKMSVGECEIQVLKLPEIQDVNNRIYSELFAGKSNQQMGARMLPRVEGFNCTWINNEGGLGRYVDAQFTFAGSEEKKVMRIINKYGGVIVDVKKDLHQNGREETNLSGKNYKFDHINEILEAKSWR